MMKRFYTLLMLLPLLLGACQQNRNGLEPEPQRPEAGAKKITLSTALDLEDLPAETRMIIENNYDQNNKLDGVKFIFKKDDLVDVHAYFVQDGKIRVAPVAQMKILEKAPEDKFYKGTVEVEVPEGIDTTRDDVMMAAAIGVEKIDENGNAIINNSAPIDLGRDSKYVVPMYFPETKLSRWENKETQEKIYGIKGAHFKFYGALLEIKLTTELVDPFEAGEMVMRSKAFTSSGLMALPTATKDKVPTWTSSETEETYQRFPLEGLVIKNGTFASNGTFTPYTKPEVGHYFLWIMPSDIKKGTKANPSAYTQLWVRDAAYTLNPYENEFNPQGHADGCYFRIPHIAPMEQGKVYRPNPMVITSDLIISERFRSRSNSAGTVLEPINYWSNNIAWEFYNPTTKEIDLGNYYFVSTMPSGRKYSVRLGVQHNLADYNYDMNPPRLTPEQRQQGRRTNGFIRLRQNNTGKGIRPESQDQTSSLILPPGGVLVYATVPMVKDFQYFSYLQAPQRNNDRSLKVDGRGYYIQGQAGYDRRYQSCLGILYRVANLPATSKMSSLSSYRSELPDKTNVVVFDFPLAHNDSIPAGYRVQPNMARAFYTDDNTIHTLNKGGVADQYIIDSFNRTLTSSTPKNAPVSTSTARKPGRNFPSAFVNTSGTLSENDCNWVTSVYEEYKLYGDQPDNTQYYNHPDINYRFLPYSATGQGYFYPNAGSNGEGVYYCDRKHKDIHNVIFDFSQLDLGYRMKAYYDESAEGKQSTTYKWQTKWYELDPTTGQKKATLYTPPTWWDKDFRH